MDKDISYIMITKEQIEEKVKELGRIISNEYKDKDPVFIGVLKGVVVFFSDMIRCIDIPCQIDFLHISSYAGTESTGKPVVKKDVSTEIEGRHVVILEDIFDTGTSLQFTYEHILSKNPASVRIVTFLDKPERRRAGITVKPDYVGYTIPNEFVVGYGLDYQEHYRNLPYIGVLKKEIYGS